MLPFLSQPVPFPPIIPLGREGTERSRRTWCNQGCKEELWHQGNRRQNNACPGWHEEMKQFRVPAGVCWHWQAPGWAGGFVPLQLCSRGVYLELLIRIHKHDHVNCLLRLQLPSPLSAGTSSPFPSQMSRCVCSSFHSAPRLRTENWLEEGKRQRMDESTSLEPETDTHFHHLRSAKQRLENKEQTPSGGHQELCGNPCSLGQ